MATKAEELIEKAQVLRHKSTNQNSVEGTRRMGRPRIELDWSLILRLAVCQCTIPEIASALDVHPDTLRTNRDFVEFYEAKKERGRKILRVGMFDSARQGDKTMRVWLSKQYLGMAERHEVGGAKDGTPIVFKVIWEDGDKSEK